MPTDLLTYIPVDYLPIYLSARYFAGPAACRVPSERSQALRRSALRREADRSARRRGVRAYMQVGLLRRHRQDGGGAARRLREQGVGVAAGSKYRDTGRQPWAAQDDVTDYCSDYKNNNV